MRPPGPPHPSSALPQQPTNPHDVAARGPRSRPRHRPSCRLSATSPPAAHPGLRSRYAPPSQLPRTLHHGGVASPGMPARQRLATPSTTPRVAAPGGPAHPGWRGPSPSGLASQPAVPPDPFHPRCRTSRSTVQRATSGRDADSQAGDMPIRSAAGGGPRACPQPIGRGHRTPLPRAGLPDPPCGTRVGGLVSIRRRSQRHGDLTGCPRPPSQRRGDIAKRGAKRRAVRGVGTARGRTPECEIAQMRS